MKTSDKILIVSAILILILIIFLATTAKHIANHENSSFNIMKYSGNGKTVRREIPIDSFSGVSVNGGWEIEINSNDSNKFSVIMENPENELSDIYYYLYSGIFTVRYRSGLFYKGNMQEGIHKISISMPKLSSLEFSGGTKASFSGFKSAKLGIIVSGGCNLKGKDNAINNIVIKSSGASHIDLNESSVTNADLDTSGVSFIELNMAGGNLTGSASGVSSILYSGNIRSQNVKQSGVVNIVKR